MPELEDFLPQISNLYYEHRLSTKLISLTLGIPKTNVKRILKKAGYTLRSPSEAMKLAYKEGRASLSTFGRDKNPNWREDTSRRQKHYLSQHPHQSSGKQHTEESKMKMRGQHMSPEGRAKLSELAKARRGKNNYRYGIHLSEETKAKLREKAIIRWGVPEFREKMRIAEMGRPSKMSRIQELNWQNPEYRAKVVPACLRNRRPTDLEAKVITIIDKYSLPYKYTGNGSFKIGNLYPDFVNINGDKVAIEVFGGHWHQSKKEPIRTEEGRRAILKEYGWKLIVIWGNELKTMPEEAILEKIRGKE